MRILYFLLIALCLLFTPVAPDVGHRSDHYKCATKGGTCNYSRCPRNNRLEGTCYGGKAKCCIRIY